MPSYEYQCGICNHITTDIRPLSERDNIAICEKCGGVARKIISLPGAIITDGNFALTGKVDRRLGGRPIQGRKDYKQRIKEKGFRELSSHEAKELVDDDSERVLPTVNI